VLGVFGGGVVITDLSMCDLQVNYASSFLSKLITL